MRSGWLADNVARPLQCLLKLHILAHPKINAISFRADRSIVNRNPYFLKFMAEKKRFLRLDSIVAYMQTEVDGDEIFIKFQGEKVAPREQKFVKMSKEPVALDVEVPVGDDHWVELELWDYDHFSPNDMLGKFRLLADEVSDGFSAELLTDKGAEQARYVLNWSVIERTDA